MTAIRWTEFGGLKPQMTRLRSAVNNSTLPMVVVFNNKVFTPHAGYDYNWVLVNINYHIFFFFSGFVDYP